jgi:hypothetical protein
MNLSAIAKYRLTSQQIAETGFKSPMEMVEWFCAVQGQEYAQTKWGLGLRLPHLKDADMENDINEGKILRTHLLRPTWHLVSAEDIRWLLTLTAPRVHIANAYMYRKIELDAKTLNPCMDIIIRLLQGNKHLTRDEINQAFAKNGILASGHRLSYIMMYAELEKIVCSGIRQGNQFTYALFDERVKPARHITDDEALNRLTAQYFKSRGPATVQDYATWSGLALKDCKRGLETVKNKLHAITADGAEYYVSDDAVFTGKPVEDICLLPIYDEYIMGYKDRSAIMEYAKSRKAESSFKYDCMIIYDGQIIGTWKRTITSKRIELKYDLFSTLTDVQQEKFRDAMNRFARFNGLPIEYKPFCNEHKNGNNDRENIRI